MSDRRLYPDELCHHGILGMQWGKRNGPPYPLGANDHSASEKKAGWRKSLTSKVKQVLDESKEYNRDFQMAQMLKAGKRQRAERAKKDVSDAAKYARRRERSHLASAKRHQAEYDKLRKKSPDMILSYYSVQSGVGKNAKHYERPWTVKDEMRKEKSDIDRHKVLAKNWSAWAKAFEGPIESLDKRDLKFAKKYAKYQRGGKLSMTERFDHIDAE